MNGLSKVLLLLDRMVAEPRAEVSACYLWKVDSSFKGKNLKNVAEVIECHQVKEWACCSHSDRMHPIMFLRF